MSEPYWVPLGPGAGIDYEGSYAAGTQYVAGDIVRYQGVDYLCVNPALGQTPPQFQVIGALPVIGMGTALPSTPFDGQEFMLVDSLTAPTYSWRLRYVAAKASNKWLFIGGVPLLSEILPQENAVGNAYTDTPTVGPSVTVPVAGEYLVEFGAFTTSSGNTGTRYVSPKFGAAATLDADAAYSLDTGASAVSGFSGRVIRRTIAASTLVKLQYKHSANQTVQASQRFLVVTPVAVGG